MKTIIDNLENTCSIQYQDKSLPDIDFVYDLKHEIWKIKDEKQPNEVVCISNITDIALPFYNLFINTKINRKGGDVRGCIPIKLIDKVPDAVKDTCYIVTFNINWAKDLVRYAYINSGDKNVDLFYMNDFVVKFTRLYQADVQYMYVDIFEYVAETFNGYEKKYTGSYQVLNTDGLERTRCLYQEDVKKGTVFYYNYDDNGALNNIECVMRCGFVTLTKIYNIEYEISKLVDSDRCTQTAKIPYMFYLTFESCIDTPILYRSYDDFLYPIMVEHRKDYNGENLERESFKF